MNISKKIAVATAAVSLILAMYRFHSQQIGLQESVSRNRNKKLFLHDFGNQKRSLANFVENKLEDSEVDAEVAEVTDSKKKPEKTVADDSPVKNAADFRDNKLEDTDIHLEVVPVSNSPADSVNPFPSHYSEYNSGNLIKNEVHAKAAQVPSTQLDSDILTKNLQWMNQVTNPIYDISVVRRTQLARTSLVKKVCEQVAKSSQRFEGETQCFLFRNTIFCSLAKTGSSNMLRMLCILIGQDCVEIKTDQDEHHYIPQLFMTSLNVTDMLEYTDDHSIWKSRNFIYVMVRDPWHRLTSAYTDKVVNSLQFRDNCRFANNKKFRSYLLKRQKNGMFSFSEFLTYCVISQYDNGGPVAMDSHWRPLYVSGAFCDVSYSYIGKTETINEDVKVIFQQYSRTDATEIMQQAAKYKRSYEKTNQTAKSYQRNWKLIDRETVNKIREIYSIDFAMFNYSTDPY